jgi:hypothetical protein
MWSFAGDKSPEVIAAKRQLLNPLRKSTPKGEHNPSDRIVHRLRHMAVQITLGMMSDICVTSDSPLVHRQCTSHIRGHLQEANKP